MPRSRPRRATLLVTALVAALSLAGLASPAAAATFPVPSPDSAVDPLVDLQEYNHRVMHAINVKRKARDLPPVRRYDACTDRLSERWARTLADSGELVHRNQRTVLRRCDLAWTGETLARGTGLTPQGAVKAWMRSAPHKAVLMKKRAKWAGVGVRVDGQGRFVVVLNFADPD